MLLDCAPGRQAVQQIVPNPENPRWLKRDNGAPFFMAGPGDPEDFLYRGTENPDGTRNGDQLDLIRKMEGTGANCLYLQAIRSHGGDGDATHNPFINHDPRLGLNPAILIQWDMWFTAMDTRGIVIYFFFYDDNARIVERRSPLDDRERSMIRTIVSRFKRHRNLIWCVAEEYQEGFTAEGVKDFADTIRAADDRRHPIAVHKLQGLDFSELAGHPSIDEFAIQYNVSTADSLNEGMAQAFQQAAGRFSLNMSECKGMGSGAELRRKLWAAAMGGAYVMVLNMDVAQTPGEDLEACGHLARFFESVPFTTMTPANERKSGNTVYVLASPDGSCILYGGENPRVLGIQGLSAGTYKIRWYDCATGRWKAKDQVTADPASALLQVPDGFGEDVAAYVQKVTR